MPFAREQPCGRCAFRQLALYAGFAFAVSFSSLVQAATVRVDVSAFALVAGTFEAYVDTRQLSAPLDVARVTLLIRCRAADGQPRTAWVPFTEQMLARGSVFYKRLELPSKCSAWERLVSADVPLALGKADGPDAQVRVRRGAIGGAISLNPPLPAPQLAAPAHGSVFNHFPRKTTLSWQAVKGAGSYALEIQMGFAGAWYPWRSESKVRARWFQFEFVGAQPGRWRVWAIAPNGSPGYSSPWWEFRYSR